MYVCVCVRAAPQKLAAAYVTAAANVVAASRGTDATKATLLQIVTKAIATASITVAI